MAVSQIWRASRMHADDGRASAVGGGMRRRNRYAGPRLWALLNAQALLDGTAGSRGGVDFIEDDRRRMAAQRPT